jgi:uncharacterized membrane protein
MAAARTLRRGTRAAHVQIGAASGRREGDSAVPADPDTPGGRRVLSKGRMEGFSDGVFGFAATLLVLDLAVHPPGTPLQQVLHAWPGYLAYVVSFLTIGGTWLLHTALTDQLTQVDQLFLRLNLVALLVVVFLPFPTGLVARALHNTSGERVYVTVYGLTLLAIRLLGAALDAYARHEHLYSRAREGEELHSTQRKFLPVVIGYVIAIGIGLALPALAVAVYFGIAVYLVMPLRDAARVLIRRHSSRPLTRTGTRSRPGRRLGDAGGPSPAPSLWSSSLGAAGGRAIPPLAGSLAGDLAPARHSRDDLARRRPGSFILPG